MNNQFRNLDNPEKLWKLGRMFHDSFSRWLIGIPTFRFYGSIAIPNRLIWKTMHECGFVIIANDMETLLIWRKSPATRPFGSLDRVGRGAGRDRA